MYVARKLTPVSLNLRKRDRVGNPLAIYLLSPGVEIALGRTALWASVVARPPQQLQILFLLTLKSLGEKGLFIPFQKPQLKSHGILRVLFFISQSHIISGAEATTGTETKEMMGPQIKIKYCDWKSGGRVGRNDSTPTTYTATVKHTGIVSSARDMERQLLSFKRCHLQGHPAQVTSYEHIYMPCAHL